MSSRWRDEQGRPQGSVYRVLTMRDGRIYDWQDCRTHTAAVRYARRRVVP